MNVVPPLPSPTVLAAWLAWRAAAPPLARLARWCCAVASRGTPLVELLPPDLPEPDPGHWQLAWRQVEAMALLGLRVLPCWALRGRLAQARPLPLLLFVRGNPALLHHPHPLAIVGSRRAHPRSIAWARAQASTYARGGALVVSGGAAGIDAAAHQGALDACAPTLAFVGHAIDRIYPRINATLFARILATGGALVSEHAPLSVTFASAHACRNRLIAALAEQVLVVEAGVASGTLGTARAARRLGRPLVCAPATLGGARGGIDKLCADGWATPWPSS